MRPLPTVVPSTVRGDAKGTALREVPETPAGKATPGSKRHGNDGEAGNEQGHGYECGEITGECGHGQLRLILFMCLLCSIFVPLSIPTIECFGLAWPGRFRQRRKADRMHKDAGAGTKKPGRQRLPGLHQLVGTSDFRLLRACLSTRLIRQGAFCVPHSFAKRSGERVGEKRRGRLSCRRP
jgi:hypothetical protein